MVTTILVEPFPNGHRPQTVALVADVVSEQADVLILTSQGASDDPGWIEYLGDSGYRVAEVFDTTFPSTRELAREVAAACRAEAVDRVVVLDADQALKRWWFEAPRAFARRGRPQVVFMLTRYPATVRPTDWTGWRLRIPKAALAVLGRLTGSLHRVAGFAGRDDMSPGWIVKRARDPAVCTAHSRDREGLRRELGLAPDRAVVGVFGVITERKHAPLIWAAMQAKGIDADLLLAGDLSEDVAAWARDLAPSAHGRLVLRPGFLTNTVLDQLVAASDVAALVMTNNGPSGIMGKALAAGVPVVTAGSEVRAREARATGGGEVADLDEASIGAALERALAHDRVAAPEGSVPLATPRAYVTAMLGLPD